MLVIKLTFLGVLPNGNPTSQSLFINDVDFGFQQQNRKAQAYLRPNQPVYIPGTSRSLFSLNQGAIAKFRDQGILQVETIFRAQDFSDKGGAGGTGFAFAPVNPNVRRISGILSFVVANADVNGLLGGEEIAVTGLTGAFAQFNGTHLIQSVDKLTGLAGGPSATTWRVNVLSPGADVPPGNQVSALVTLPNGKVRAEMGSGNVGNFGPDMSLYVGGDAIVTGTLDPEIVQFSSIDPTEVGNQSVFSNALDNNLLYYKDALGILHNLTDGGGGGGGSGTPSQVVFRPGAAPSDNIYNTWTAAYAAAKSFNQPVWMIVDDSLAPAVMDIGTWDLSDLLITSPRKFDPAVGVGSELRIPDGATLVASTGFIYLTFVRLRYQGTAPCLTVPDGEFRILGMDTGAEVSSENGPVFLVEDNGFLFTFVIQSDIFNAGGPYAEVSPLGLSIFQMWNNGTVDEDVLTGNGTVFIETDSNASFNFNQPNFSGFIGQELNSSADKVFYDNSVSGLTAENVQDAIDEIAIGGGGGGGGGAQVTYRPGATPVGSQYDNWVDAHAAAAALVAQGNEVTLYVDSQDASPVVPAGVWNMERIQIHGATTFSTALGTPVPTLFFQDGAQLSYGTFGSVIRLKTINLVSQSSSPIIEIPENQLVYGLFEIGTSFQAEFAPFIRLNTAGGSGAIGFFVLDAGCSFNFAGSPILEVTTLSNAQMLLYEDARIQDNNLISGDGFLNVSIISPAARFAPQSGFIGGLNLNLQSEAQQVLYNPFLAPSPSLSSAGTVQEAIDLLANSGSVPQLVFRPGGPISPAPNVYGNWFELYGAITLLDQPVVVIMDPSFGTPEIQAGTYDLTNVTFRGIGEIDGNLPTTNMIINPGVTFTATDNIFRFEDLDVLQLGANTIQAVGFARTRIISKRCVFRSGVGGGALAFMFSNSFLVWELHNYSSLRNESAPLIDRSGGTLIFDLSSNSEVRDDGVVVGTGPIEVHFSDSNTTYVTQTTNTGTVTTVLGEAGALTAYTSPIPDFDPSTVQDAIDRLAVSDGRLNIPPVATSDTVIEPFQSLRVDSTGGPVQIELSALTVVGAACEIIKIDGADPVTIIPQTGSIYGGNVVLSNTISGARLRFDGTNWMLVSLY